MIEPGTRARRLAGTLRWCADKGEVRGLHPEKVREAAQLLEQQEKRILDLEGALAANEHVVTLDPKPVWQAYAIEFGITMAITSPIIREASIVIDERQLYEAPVYFLDDVARKMTEICTRPWREELALKTRRAIGGIDFAQLRKEGESRA